MGPLLVVQLQGELADSGTWMDILTCISSLTCRYVNTKQANGLLAAWVCRNGRFNEESLKVSVRRAFLSLDSPLLMARNCPASDYGRI